MHVAVSTAEAVRAKLKPLIDSKRYWTLVLPPAAFDIAVDMERRFYQHEASEDFHLSFGPLAHELVAVVVAHKRWLPAKAFMKLLKRHGGQCPPGFQIGERDVVIPSVGDAARCQALAAALFCWLADLHPENN